MSSKRLSGKTAFITGAGRGQGRAIATKFAGEGANIVMCDVAQPIDHIKYDLASEEDLKESTAAVEQLGAGVVSEVADVRVQADIDRVVSAGLDAFGQIDIVVA